jgi:hypothetical protein
MKKFSETNIGRIGIFLKNTPNKSYTTKDISINLGIKPKSVSSSLSRLKSGKNKTGMINGRKRILKTKSGKNRKTGYEGFKIGTIKNTSKGRWEFFTKTKFKLWKVDFKLIETNSKNKKKNRWAESGNMDLSGYAIGLVPSGIEKSKVVGIAAAELFRKSLDIMQGEGVSLWNAVAEDDSKTVYLGGQMINENPLDKVYDSTWDGKINFVNNIGNSYSYNVNFDIDIDEYD